MGRVPINQQPVNRQRDHNARLRGQAAYRLWLAGKSFEAIAVELGYKDGSGARKAWEREREALIAPEDIVLEVERERARLEIAYAGIFKRVEKGYLFAIDRALGINKAKRELLGLDARAGAAEIHPNEQKVIILHEGPADGDSAAAN